MASEFRDGQRAGLRKQLAATTKQEATKQAAKQAAKHAAKLTKRAAIEQAKAEALAAEAERAARHGDVYEHLAQHLEAIDVWLRKRDTRKPKLSPDDIAAVAMELADAEGLEHVTMRRIAAELGVGTMTLYHYVRTKDDLMTLLTDRVLAEVNLPAGHERPTRWQDSVRLIAHRTLTAIRRHPWVLEIHDDPPVGPNGIRHFDQTLAAVATYPGSLTDRLDLMAAIDEFVFGFALMERTNFHDPANEPPAPLLDYLETLLDTEDLPALQEFAQEHGVSGGWAIISNHGRDPERFDRQLDRLIAGFDASR